MSDTEDGSFDREAEKEKLREQLQREEENRRSTQHMSELLLKGATMTNKHCDVCGDPLFRYEGQEFCPTCAQEETAQESADDEAVEDADTGEETDATAGTTDAVATDALSTDAVTTDTMESGVTGVDTAPTVDGDESPAPSTVQAPQTQAGSAEDIASARAALVRKLSALARQAEATDDVSRSRELLSATREAAEALAAIDAVRR